MRLWCTWNVRVGKSDYIMYCKKGGKDVQDVRPGRLIIRLSYILSLSLACIYSLSCVFNDSKSSTCSSNIYLGVPKSTDQISFDLAMHSLRPVYLLESHTSEDCRSHSSVPCSRHRLTKTLMIFSFHPINHSSAYTTVLCCQRLNVHRLLLG